MRTREGARRYRKLWSGGRVGDDTSHQNHQPLPIRHGSAGNDPPVVDIACPKRRNTIRTYKEHRGATVLSDSSLDKVPAYNRISTRAILVHEGEDAGAVLAEAGFAETISVPVVLG